MASPIILIIPPSKRGMINLSRDKTQALLCPPGLPKQPSQHLQGPHMNSGSFIPMLTQHGGKVTARGGRTGQGLLDLGKGGAHRHHPCSAPRAEEGL